jgi:phosphoribosyl 1,2-cyclic phosphodiesterase
MEIDMKNCKICCLYSGSKGNSTYISAGGANILIDAGKSAKSLCLALSEIGVDVDSIDAIFITHEHNDHISALRTLSHKHKIPIHMLLSSARVFDGLCDEKLCNCLTLYKGNEFETKVKGLTVKAFATPHDSRGSVGYRLSFNCGGENVSIAYATDTGYVTDVMTENALGCFAAVIESNHDVEMLMNGPYPYELKKRIRSKHGHLSNSDCAILAANLAEHGTKHILLAHLSEENNDPNLAYNEVLSAIADTSVNLMVASQYEPVWLLGGSSDVSNIPKEELLWQPSDS